MSRFFAHREGSFDLLSTQPMGSVHLNILYKGLQKVSAVLGRVHTMLYSIENGLKKVSLPKETTKREEYPSHPHLKRDKK